MKGLRLLTDRWIERPSLDYLLTAAVVLGVLVARPADPVPGDLQGAWIQTLASVDGVLLGVSGIALTLVFTVTPTDRLSRVYETVGPRLSRLLLSSVGGLAWTTIGFAGLFLLQDHAERYSVAATAGLVVFTALRLARLWWLIQRIAMALSVPDKPEPSTDGPWVRPGVHEHDYSLPGRTTHDAPGSSSGE